MKRWIRNGAFGFVGLVVFLSVGGAVYQYIGNAIDQKRYPPPGKLVDVGGHRLHLNCTGTGSPTVVMEAMGQGWSLHWGTVQPEIAKFARVCTYDRAGYGWSDPGPPTRTAQQIASELHTLLRNAQIPGPYVLVGHSFGGYVVRIYRHQYPNEVAGMVLVDAGHEDVWEYPQRRKAHDAFARSLPVVRIGAALGTVRLLAAFEWSPFFPEKQFRNIPPDMRPILRAGLARTSFVTTVAQEDTALPETQNQARVAGTLDDLRLIVLTANRQAWLSKVPVGVDAAAYNSEWLELQQKLVRLSSRSTQILADKSSHYVPLDQPDVVVDGVQQVLGAIRKEGE